MAPSAEIWQQHLGCQQHQHDSDNSDNSPNSTATEAKTTGDAAYREAWRHAFGHRSALWVKRLCHPPREWHLGLTHFSRAATNGASSLIYVSRKRLLNSPGVIPWVLPNRRVKATTQEYPKASDTAVIASPSANFLRATVMRRPSTQR